MDAEGDDEWIFRSETPPRSLKSNPFSLRNQDRKQRDSPLIYCRGLARYVRKEARHLSFQTGGHEARRFSTPSKCYIQEILVDIFVYKGAVHPSFRSDLVWITFRMIEIRALKCRLVDFSFNLCFEKVIDTWNCILHENFFAILSRKRSERRLNWIFLEARS